MLNLPIVAIAPPDRIKNPAAAAIVMAMKVAIGGYILVKLYERSAPFKEVCEPLHRF